MGISCSEFIAMTWRSYVLTVRGFNKKRSREFEHTRSICYHIVAVNRDPKKPFPKIEKFWPLPTDDENAPSEQQEYKRLKEKLNKFKQGKLKT